MGADSVRQLDLLVTDVATRLMGANAESMVSVTEDVLDELLSFFGVDHTCLRYNDHAVHATVLVAESPQRVKPDPDPLGVLYFTEAVDAFRASETRTDVFFGRPRGEFPEYEAAVLAGAGMAEVSFASAPLMAEGVPTGNLTLTKGSDRIWSADEVNSLRAIAALFAQLQGRIAAEEQLRHNATHDELTGLCNRGELLTHLGTRLEAGRDGPVVALFIDLDRFNALNDFLGHTAGDEFIRIVADRLREGTGRRDFVARFGGDEFVIVPQRPTSIEEAEIEARKIKQILGERVKLGGETVSRSVSIGIAVGTPGLTSVQDVLRQADRSVVAAKAAGGNSIVLFTDAMRTAHEMRDDVELNLRSAVENDSLLLHYQPEVDLRTGHILAVEALVRWQHPTRGLLQPASFIEVAEATNLAGELGRWVIRAACAQLAQWRSNGNGLDLVIRINVSPVQLVSLDFVDAVERVLDEFGIDGKSVCLEITEHVVVSDLERTRVTLEALSRIGVHVAIDDFGTGFSSLSHLKELTVDALKIDRGFVEQLGNDSDDFAIVKSIIGLANSFDMDIVAEGVETPLAARTLLELGCYRAQGYLLSRPLPAPEAELLLAKGAVAVDFDLAAGH